eukprot:scaffold75189_cov121-Cyclotella_meneghiniana.AAC.2
MVTVTRPILKSGGVMEKEQNGSMIVDFPSSTLCSLGKRSKPVKSVSFSRKSEGRYIRYPTASENQAKWYSWQDEQRFKRAVIHDAIVVSLKIMADDSISIQGQLVLQDFVGLDHLISRDVLKRYQVRKLANREHVRLVLEEQSFQRHQQRISAEDLSQVASMSSQWQIERACKVGALIESIAGI